MILPFLSIFFLVSFIFVLKKNNNKNRNEEKKKNEKGPLMTTVFKVDRQTCIDKIHELILEFGEEMNFSVDKLKDWVIVSGIRDDIERLSKILNSQLEMVLSTKDEEGDKKKDEKGFVITRVFRLPVDCLYVDDIQKVVLKFKGVRNVSVDMDKDLVIVNGTMDMNVKVLTRYLFFQALTIGRKDKKDKQNEGEKGPETTTVFKVPFCSHSSIVKKLILNFEGVTDMSVDSLKDLVPVKTKSTIALTNYIIKKFKRRVKRVPSEKDKESKQSNEVVNGNGGSDEGDGDSSGGGDRNKKKGSGGDGDSDGDDRDKGERGGGCEKGLKMDGMGEYGFGYGDYEYGYHAGFENGYPVGQLHVSHVTQMSKSDHLNGKEDRQFNEVGNGIGHGSGSKDDNNGDGGGKTKGIKMNYMGQLAGSCDGGGQLHVAHMFCPENLNACSNIRPVV